MGSGSTGAIHKLIGILDLKEPPVNFIKSLEESYSKIVEKQQKSSKIRR